jgi:hypothetical protein
MKQERKPNKVDAVKHPERMGPLGDMPQYEGSEIPPQSTGSSREVREDARIADREQMTTSE